MPPADDLLQRSRASRRATGAGLVGAAGALLCCAGVAPVLGVVTALGLGWLLHDAILVPLLVLGLGVTGWGLWQGRRCHGRRGPLVMGLTAGLVTAGGVFAWVPLAFAGFLGVLAAGIWNLAAVRACVARRPDPA
jgi:mercuric ion transport protein